MGRRGGGHKRGRTQRRHFRDGRDDPWKKKPRPDLGPDRDNDNDDDVGDATTPAEPPPPQQVASGGTWDPFVTENPAFNLYYKQQRIVPDDEWDKFIAVLRKPLPAVFRINSSGQFAREINDQIQQEFVESLKTEVVEDVEELLRPLPWYPGKLAWHLSFSRMQLRKNQTLARIHDFLKRENEIGNITRQEAVSMVPPLFLDVMPHHRVLDMCAAPGSKTFQLLEMIHSDDKKGLLPDGVVIANDLDVQRCHLLIHQTKRMCSPNLIVTNHEAQHFPGLRKEKDAMCPFNGSTERSSNVKVDSGSLSFTEDDERGLYFDRVLCDVPCSGDGTIRKAPDLWKKWNAGIGNGLHRLQVQIAMRGVALLKVGGRLVYSTCSLNPIENEAVVGEILRRSSGCLELLDVSDELPELKCRPGLKTWKVRDKGVWISSYKDVNKHRAGSIVPGMFPTGKCLDDDVDGALNAAGIEQVQLVDNGVSAEIGDEGEYATLPLERCLRILPHDQDTGGFFIAIFRKISAFKVEHFTKSTANKESKQKLATAEIPGEMRDEDAAGDVLLENKDHTQCYKNERGKLDVEQSSPALVDVNQKSNRIQRQGNWKGVDPVLFLKDEALINSIVTFYGIKETIQLHGRLVTRSEDTSRLKRIYYVSDSVAAVMKMNFRAGEQMKITSVGLKLFERQGGKEGLSDCAFRIASEGLPLLLPHLTKQIVYASRKDFKLLLSLKKTPFTSFTDPCFTAAVDALFPGCCVVILNDGQGTSISTSTIAIGCWRGRSNMSLLIPTEEAQQLLDRLFSIDEDNVDIEKEKDGTFETKDAIEKSDGTTERAEFSVNDDDDDKKPSALSPSKDQSMIDEIAIVSV